MHLNFLGYKVTEMSFKINNEAQAEKNFKIAPKIKMDLRQSDKTLLMSVTVTVDRNQPSPTPFELNVVLAASFLIVKPADIETLRTEACTMIYPYVRSTVSNLTVNANIPPYFMPLINFERAGNNEQGSNVVVRPVDEDIIL